MASKIVEGLFGGSPNYPVSRKELSYPLYGADFDPLNHDFLLVGGGGGSSSTGVPNRISLLDTSKRTEISEIADIELAPDEDSVTSLAVAHSDDQSLLAYAGINSSVRDQSAGRNEHFRSFIVPLPARRKRDATDPTTVPATTVAASQALGRSTIFRAANSAKSDTYQKVLRLSPPIIEEAVATIQDEKAGQQPRKLRKRMTVIASALAPQNEIVTFPATKTPSTAHVSTRISLESKEATDADIVNVDGHDLPCVLAYSTDHELYFTRVGEQLASSNVEPVQVYETTTGPKGRSKIRGVRFLNNRYLLLLQNRAERSGVELVVLRVSNDFSQAQQSLVKYLKHIKQATSLDTCSLSKAQDDSQQFVVAVAGQDSSIQILTLDWIAGKGLTAFDLFAEPVNVHNGPITRIRFSYFIPPTLPITGQTPPQYIRLASVGVDKNVVVQTLPLRPSPPTGTGRTRPRYVLSASREYLSFFYNAFMAFFVLVLVLALTISFFEFRGAMPPYIGVTKYLPQRWQEKYGRSYPYAYDPPGPVIPDAAPAIESMIDRIKLSEATPIIEKLEAMQSSIPSVDDVQDTLSDLVSRKKEESAHKDKAVIIRDLEEAGGAVSAELRHDAEIVKEGTLKKWENLSKQDQKTWKAKLKAAGHWTENMGETVLKGVFFSELAGAVGAFIRNP
ncbi:hypothetical protein H2198_004355 [Neophaeococcomyces mojaviensis]|uniref:Uncharacterized protein n=1 Tax=Neophaeococcomyces mojaviensis TaxID=3383035 RepID=A0ACC3A970_9EURO|nr:hypothetical protein H2198_004355 [Knufia sp. JES_112]